MSNTRVGIFFVVCCMGWPSSGRADEPKLDRHEYESRLMGTTFRIVLFAPDRPAAEHASRAAFSRVAELERILSDYNPDSELMRLCRANDASPGKLVPVSSELYAILDRARLFSEQTDGAFDVTIGPLVRLWRTARRTQQLPTPAELDEARAMVGFRKITLDPANCYVALAVPGMRLDFGGIAKGYAADEALAMLRGRGITHALVAASGDIVVSDPPPGQEGWVVEVAPLAPGLPARRLNLANAAVSTSGDLFQFVEIAGMRYSHILDPSTGLGLTGRRSATVIAPDGTTADALATAASVLPPERALKLIEALDRSVAIITIKETEEAPERVWLSERFERYTTREADHEGTGMRGDKK